MNEKDKKKKIVMSVVVAGLLILSVLTAATVGVSAENTEEETSEEETSTVAEEHPELYDKVIKQIEDVKGDRDPTDPVIKPDVLDQEMTEILSGAETPNDMDIDFEGILTDPHTKDQHNVDAVHDMGITGENVTVSLMDTGFDMAQPDLVGTHAVFEYDEETMPEEYEAYDGHPIAFDPVSMIDYALDGNISQDYEVEPGYPDNSWYVDTSYENTTYEDGGDIVADFSEKEGDITYTMPDGVEAGEKVRFGLHPDEKLYTAYLERPAVLLTQDDGGDWSNIYVDLENDRVFENETRAWIDGDDPESEAINKDINGDGIPDISGGMVYFFSDGETPIPYSQHMRDRINTILNLFLGYPPGTVESLVGTDAWQTLTESDEFHTTPEDGEMVALMGDFNGFGSYGTHGTQTASAVAGQGVTGEPGSGYPPGEDPGLAQGVSPDAKIIPMGRFFDYLPSGHPLQFLPNSYTSLFFTADGYTGDPAIDSDTADVASSSFGSTVGENHGGFNFYERLFDYVGTQYTQNTLFVNSEGNEGSGFGTVSAPSGAKGVLSVGATGNQMYRVDEWNDYDGGPNPWYGEVTGMTSAGPHSMGSHGPDIMTNGQFGYSGSPLNQQLDEIGTFDGATSYTLWSGTSLSAPNAAGIAALVYQAYEEAQDEDPDSQTVKNIVMQGANDINNSPHLQGPGDADALAAVEIAQGEGLYSEESEWRPGMNHEMGAHVEHHVNMLEPGENTSDELTLHNWNQTEDRDYEMSAMVEEQVGSTELELNSGSMGPYPDDENESGRVPLVMINETGVYELSYNETDDQWNISSDPIAELDAPNADLLRLGTHTPYENQGMLDYSLTEFYNWEDVDGNGAFDGFDERNRIGSTSAHSRADELYGYEAHTSDYFSIHDALERAEDGIVVQMNNQHLNMTSMEFDPGLEEPFEFTLNIEQYNQVEWDWIEIEEPTGTVGDGETLEYNVTAEVPEEAPKGIHGGKLMIDDVTNGRTQTVPITITVGKSTDLSEPMKFGAGDGSAAEDMGIYKNDRLYGSWAGGLTGDWRFYTFHLEKKTQRRVEVNLDWDDEDSDMSAYLLGGATRDTLEVADLLEEEGISGYGKDPFSVEDQLVDPSWNYMHRYGFNTLETMEPLVEYHEGDSLNLRSQERLTSGTYMVAVQSHRISGHEPFQEFEGEVRQVPVSISPDYGDVIQGDLVNITAETYEPFANLTSAEITLDDFYEAQKEDIGSQEVNFDIPFVLSTTSHTYDVSVEDEDGNTYLWEDVTFEVDNMAPTLEITKPDGGVTEFTQSEEIVIEGVVDIDDAETVYIDRTDITEQINQTTGEFSVTRILDTEGYNEFTVVAEDEAGNIAKEVVSVLYLPEIGEIWDSIYGLENETWELEQEIMGLSDELNRVEDRLETQIDYIESTMEDLEGDVDELQGTVRDLDISLKQLEFEVETLQGELDELRYELQTAKSELEDRIDELEEQMEIDLEEVKEDLEDKIDELEEQIEAYEEQIDNLESDISTMESDVNSLERDINSVEDDQEEQDEDIGMARNLGIIGLILAILALIAAAVAMSKGGKPAEEEPEEEVFEETEEPEEEDLFEEESEEEDIFGEESEEEDLFEEESEEEELFEEESEEEELFEEESEEEELFEEESEEEEL
ncbi:MAG: S8 family serine peptidase [Candidatus Natronoplasma sp.]